MRIAICIAGAVCDLVMWQKPTWMRLGSMRRADGVRGGRAGGARVGIGTRGSADSLLFRETEFSIARSGGDFIRRGTCTARRFMDTATDATVTAGATIISPAPNRTKRGPRPTPHHRPRIDAGGAPAPGLGGAAVLASGR